VLLLAEPVEFILLPFCLNWLLLALAGISKLGKEDSHPPVTRPTEDGNIFEVLLTQWPLFLCCCSGGDWL